MLYYNLLKYINLYFLVPGIYVGQLDLTIQVLNKKWVYRVELKINLCPCICVILCKQAQCIKFSACRLHGAQLEHFFTRALYHTSPNEICKVCVKGVFDCIFVSYLFDLTFALYLGF